MRRVLRRRPLAPLGQAVAKARQRLRQQRLWSVKMLRRLLLVLVRQALRPAPQKSADSAASAAASASSATASAGSATAASGSQPRQQQDRATAAAGSATSAATSATDAAASLDEFTDIYLGAKVYSSYSG